MINIWKRMNLVDMSMAGKVSSSSYKDHLRLSLYHTSYPA
jgi:hypothetical protein